LEEAMERSSQEGSVFASLLVCFSFSLFLDSSLLSSDKKHDDRSKKLKKLLQELKQSNQEYESLRRERKEFSAAPTIRDITSDNSDKEQQQRASSKPTTAQDQFRNSHVLQEQIIRSENDPNRPLHFTQTTRKVLAIPYTRQVTLPITTVSVVPASALRKDGNANAGVWVPQGSSHVFVSAPQKSDEDDDSMQLIQQTEYKTHTVSVGLSVFSAVSFVC
jgi:hypothetical protein